MPPCFILLIHKAEFQVFIDLSDHTGTRARCLLAGKVAENLLCATVPQFISLERKEIAKMKWKLCLRRFKVSLKSIWWFKLGLNKSIICFCNFMKEYGALKCHLNLSVDRVWNLGSIFHKLDRCHTYLCFRKF